jgi:hypothetical protein
VTEPIVPMDFVSLAQHPPLQPVPDRPRVQHSQSFHVAQRATMTLQGAENGASVQVQGPGAVRISWKD